MIRITLVTLFVGFFSIYASKDWFKSLCALIILMAFVEHPDMPNKLLNIPGLNHWNILFMFTILGWIKARATEGLVWDMPKTIAVLLLIYLFVVVIGFVRMMSDRTGIEVFAQLTGAEPYTALGCTNEYLFNTIKWVIPSLLLFDGCRSEERQKYALFSIMCIYLLLALQVIKAMPLNSVVSGVELQRRAVKVLSSNVGYHRVNLSMMLSGASWGFFMLRTLSQKKIYHLLTIAGSLIIFYGQALTGGRMGYITWMMLGIFYCSFRWRKGILFLPIMVVTIITVIPSVSERMTQGFTSKNDDIFVEEKIDTFAVTAGRTLVWPLAIEKIWDRPLLGFGREAMQNTGLSMHMAELYGAEEAFPHPHNAYLQWFMDNGILLGFSTVVLYLLLWKMAYTVFVSEFDTLQSTIGGVAFVLIGALLIASFGSQSFYPREGSVGMWCAIGLMLRVFVDRSHVLQTRESLS